MRFTPCPSIDTGRLKLRPGVNTLMHVSPVPLQPWFSAFLLSLRVTVARSQRLAALRIPALVFSAGLADIVECFLVSEGSHLMMSGMSLIESVPVMALMRVFETVCTAQHLNPTASKPCTSFSRQESCCPTWQ
jgi:uncharacterized membrane protein